MKTSLAPRLDLVVAPGKHAFGLNARERADWARQLHVLNGATCTLPATLEPKHYICALTYLLSFAVA